MVRRATRCGCGRAAGFVGPGRRVWARTSPVHGAIRSGVAAAHPEHVIDTRLVFIEGVMGSGKSTTGRRIADVLGASGALVVFVPEATEPHPVRVMGALPDPRRPWSHLTVGEYREASVRKWVQFVEAASASTVVYVFDGQLLHGDLTSMMLMDGRWTALQASSSTM